MWDMDYEIKPSEILVRNRAGTDKYFGLPLDVYEE
jgi:hypothetical protein